ncbi:MAG: hypothetical protein E7242_11110 [Lachnospiraceae bacterium]|nr:hypothetical protein [Lachnospiraceae bacterium]
MGKSENIIKFEEALKKDPEKMKAFEEAQKRIFDEKSAKNDGEIMVKAAKEVGFDITIEEIDRSIAEKQEIDDELLDEVVGAAGCTFDYSCHYVFKHGKDQNIEDLCFDDYNCFMLYEDICNVQAY